MLSPLHLGVEHPNLVWIAAVGLLAFVVGLGVNLCRSLADAPRIASRTSDGESE
ncbi:hypothetical protein [Halorussus salinisoli]|uniref:hypothetical protein n=1 Tax=Halorussus salinisoli TaxID=2558242 RepID=UPI001485A710|nr:hypothetical protein [Halorussus salinisoli]